MKTAYTLLILLMITPAYSSEFDEEFAVYSSNGSVETVAKKLEGAIKNRKLNIFQVIDHGANAEKAGLKLLASRVYVFGNPIIGTKLMQCAPSIAFDLPLRISLRKAQDGAVMLEYRSIENLARTHNLENCAEVVSKVSKMMKAIAIEALK